MCIALLPITCLSQPSYRSPVYHVHSPLTDHLFITALLPITCITALLLITCITALLLITCLSQPLPITCLSPPSYWSPVYHSPLTDHSLECYLENKQVTPAASLSIACTRKGTLIYISVTVNGWPRFVKWCSAREVPPRYTHAGPSHAVLLLCLFVCCDYEPVLTLTYLLFLFHLCCCIACTCVTGAHTLQAADLKVNYLNMLLIMWSEC